MNLDFAAMQENIEACDAQIAASGAVLGMMAESLTCRAQAVDISSGNVAEVHRMLRREWDRAMNGNRRDGDPVPVGFLKLPVREMTEAKSAPAGLTKIATDGEKNGRMAWVPGA